MYVYICIYICMYIYIHMYVYVYICIYIYSVRGNLGGVGNLGRFFYFFIWLARDLLFDQNGRLIAHFKDFFLYFHNLFTIPRLAFRKHDFLYAKVVACAENCSYEQKCH